MIETTTPIARFLVVFAAFVIVVSGLKMAGPLLVPFLLAVFIAMIVSPLLAWLKNRRVPGGLAILMVVMMVFEQREERRERRVHHLPRRTTKKKKKSSLWRRV